MKLLMLDRIYINTVYVFFVAAIWTVLFFANGYIFDAAEVAPLVSFVFLPAALRPVAVLLFGVPGVIGLILGAALTMPTVEIVNTSTVLMVI